MQHDGAKRGATQLTNLKLMRQFYLQNTARIGQTASDRLGAFRLSSSHCVFLLGVKNANERSCYEIEAPDAESAEVLSVIRGVV